MDKLETEKYYKLKEKRINELIAPICSAFPDEIETFEFVISESYGEYLWLNGTKIGCTGNSEYAIVNEIIKYLFVVRKMYHFFPNGERMRKEMTRYWV